MLLKTSRDTRGVQMPNPRQNAPAISDGSPTKGDVMGQNPVTKTKQQTAHEIKDCRTDASKINQWRSYQEHPS
jgi:hypothetical protein